MKRILLKRTRRHRLGFRRAVDATRTSSVLSSSNHASRLMLGGPRKYESSNEGRTHHPHARGLTTTTYFNDDDQRDACHCSSSTTPSTPATRPALHRRDFSSWSTHRQHRPSQPHPHHRFHQLQQRRQFHATKKEEVLPYIIIGAGVTYVFAKWIQNYRDSKALGDLDDEEDDEEDNEEGRSASRKKRVVINAAGVAGLDLGSVYSRVGVALAEEKEDDIDSDDDDYDSDDDDGTPKNWYTRVVENAEGSRSTVSLVGLQPGETEFVVGDKAKNLAGANFWASHCLLGHKHGDPTTSTFAEHFQVTNQLIPGIGGTMQVQIDESSETKASPELLTSRVIQHLTTLASGYIPSGKCSHVLIAVPDNVVDNELACTSFDIAMRQAGVQSLGVERQAVCAIHGEWGWGVGGF
jgi:hypothetical protein